jgi:hypothetical protein
MVLARAEPGGLIMNGQRRLLAAVCCAVQWSCTAPDADAQLRSLIAAAEGAAEARDTGFFRDVLGASYTDTRGNQRADMINLIRGYFLITTDIEVLNRIESIELLGDDAAVATLQTALVGRGGSSALDLDADLYRIELELIRESSGWQVVGAAWDDTVR